MDEDKPQATPEQLDELPELKEMSVPELLDEIATLVPDTEDCDAFKELASRVRCMYPEQHRKTKGEKYRSRRCPEQPRQTSH